MTGEHLAGWLRRKRQGELMQETLALRELMARAVWLAGRSIIDQRDEDEMADVILAAYSLGRYGGEVR